MQHAGSINDQLVSQWVEPSGGRVSSDSSERRERERKAHRKKNNQHIRRHKAQILSQLPLHSRGIDSRCRCPRGHQFRRKSKEGVAFELAAQQLISKFPKNVSERSGVPCRVQRQM